MAFFSKRKVACYILPDLSSFAYISTATDVEGIFRLSGSAKRIKELQTIFDSPDRYGKGLDWTGYTVHDAANIFRRYLNQLPQPIVPLDTYELFRDPLRSHQAQAVGDIEAQAQELGDFDQEEAIVLYQRLITQLPPLNRQLLLYILDLLAVFASKSDLNRMTSANLSAIFQPGMLSHPSHDMKPEEYRLSQDVIIFLIENQDSFLIGMSGTAADEKTVKEVQSGVQSLRPTTPTPPKATQAGLGRSASNASAGADSLRKLGIRRNVSVSSKNSRNSTGVPSPVTPSSGVPYASSSTGSGVHRSNTVPSKKSPGLASSRFNRATDSPTSATAAGKLSPGLASPTSMPTSPGSRLADSPEDAASKQYSPTAPTGGNSPKPAPPDEPLAIEKSSEKLMSSEKGTLQLPNTQALPTPAKERKVSSLFSKSPSSDAERKDTRPPNKLKKRRIPSSANPSAHSSTNSLHGAPDSPANQAFYTPLPTPGAGLQMLTDPMASTAPTFSNTDATPSSEVPPTIGDGTQEINRGLSKDSSHDDNGSTLRLTKPRSPSVHSRSSVTDLSEADHTDDPTSKGDSKPKKRRWRFSSSARKNGQPPPVPAFSSSQIGSNAVAENSTSTVGSSGRPQNSTTYDSPTMGTEASSTALQSIPSVPQRVGEESNLPKDTEALKDKEAAHDQPEKKGPIGWLKAKRAEQKERREAEKERTKSPPRDGGERNDSKQSVPLATRGRSMDVPQADEAGHDSKHNGTSS